MSSYSSHDGSEDPNAGRHTILIVAGIGLAAVVGYGVMQAGRAARAPVDAPVQVQPAETARASINELAEAVQGARHDLDVSALAKLEEQLARAAEETTMPQRATEAQLVRLEALSARALEAAVRSKQNGPGADGAQKTAKNTLAQGRRVLANLQKDSPDIDPARLRAAEARLALASGDDITQSHPVVLLPTFRDPELRLAALSRPLWFEQQAPEDDEVLEVVEELERADPQTALTRSLLAMALHTKGEDQRALSEVDKVLERVPSQPLALSLRRAMGGEPAVVAVNEPPDIDGSAGDPIPTADPTSPDPTAEDPVEPPEPATATGADTSDGVKLEPVEPTPPPAGTKLEPVEPSKPATPKPATPKPEPVEEPKPEPATPKPEPVEKPKPKPTKPKPTTTKPAGGEDFAQLLAQGCKDVRSGDAEQGLAMLRKAFDMKPGSSKVTLCMAEGQAKLGRDASARALVDRVLRSSPNNVKALLLAGKLADKAGNKAVALRHYKKVLEVQPDNAKAKAYVEKND